MHCDLAARNIFVFKSKTGDGFTFQSWKFRDHSVLLFKSIRHQQTNSLARFVWWLKLFLLNNFNWIKIVQTRYLVCIFWGNWAVARMGEFKDISEVVLKLMKELEYETFRKTNFWINAFSFENTYINNLCSICSSTILNSISQILDHIPIPEITDLCKWLFDLLEIHKCWGGMNNILSELSGF